jgi:hypothetical protein
MRATRHKAVRLMARSAAFLFPIFCAIVGPLGEIFDHACDNIGGAFSAVAFMRILASFEGIESFAHPAVMWYGVQAYCVAFLLCHLFAFDHPERKIVFKVIALTSACSQCSLPPHLSVSEWPRGDPSHNDVDNGAFDSTFGSCLLADGVSAATSRIHARCLCRSLFLRVQAQLHVRCLFPSYFPYLISTCSYDYFPFVEQHINLIAVDVVYNSVRVLFLLALAFALFSVFRMRQEFLQSKIILLTIFVVRMVPSVLISLKFGTVADPAGPSIIQIVGDGLYLAILTSDLIIAKIANRQVHVLLPVIALASVISHHVSIVAAFIYHLTIIYDLCIYLQVC